MDRIRKLVLAVAAFGVSLPALSYDITNPRPKYGKLVERSLTPDTVTVYLTDKDGNVIRNTPSSWKDGRRLQLKGDTSSGYSGTMDIPPSVPKSGGGSISVMDVRQTTEKVGSTGEVADLSIEAMLTDPLSNQRVLVPVFDYLEVTLGFGYAPVGIPDLFADTDRNGTLGAGDILYSLVNLPEFLVARPNFSLGQSFTLVAGLSDELPGMVFSLTPFVFDKDTGFTGTWYSDAIPVPTNALVLSSHFVSGVPEPETYAMMLAGLGLLGLAQRRRKQKAVA